MNPKIEYVVLCLKGMAMGAANVIPGVSGGTIAFITGIYERLVASLSKFDMTALKLLFTGKFAQLWKHIDGSFLAAVLIGIAIAAVSLAKLMLVLLSNYAVQTWAFFFGLILASAIIMLRDFNGKKFSEMFWLIFGVILGVFVCTLGEGGGYDGLWYIFICGMASFCAMILPGISGSFILLVMGKYEFIMQHIDGLVHLNPYSLLVLVVFALGCIVGILLFAKFLHWLLARWYRGTMLTLTGFVIGSLVKVWPWNAYDSTPDPLTGAVAPLHVGAAIVCCIAGAVLILGLEWLGNRIKSRSESYRHYGEEKKILE